MTFRFHIEPDIAAMVDRHKGSTIAERDRILAKKFSDLVGLWIHERSGPLHLHYNGQSTQAYGQGPTLLAYELTRGLKALDAYELAMFEAANRNGNGGICLRFDRYDDEIVVSRSFPSPELTGPTFFRVGWTELVEAVESYLRWHHNDYTAEATWLLQVPYVQQMRIEAGYPADHL